MISELDYWVSFKHLAVTSKIKPLLFNGNLFGFAELITDLLTFKKKSENIQIKKSEKNQIFYNIYLRKIQLVLKYLTKTKDCKLVGL